MSAARTFAAALASVLLLAGCGTSVTGTPLPEGSGVSGGGSDRFDKLLRECEAVPNEKIAEVLGGDGIDQYFYGAVCMWTVSSHAGSLDVTFGWFENNSLQRERDVAEQLGYQVETTFVAGASAFTARRPGDSATCGITAAYSGVITWWVQQRSGTGDPCAGARTLAELTLQRNQ
ncbi:DUF3558 domain-containing protein [Rhodococcus tibetensis]|uniref:DUF3558 domain-containing protein n=1 Tax=Rhodococcus tibetensis TaxID=2965064 RepID=A0ABT1QI96_9NOCA|nr:DUF3558 domain-containing protein [Rhodococcus sp. FXJ9.536]MCQ4122009.1 DUF3558 domain-containing protein [Rhodococcus sp. FXJ9.536]